MRLMVLSLALPLALILAPAAIAADVTLQGKVVCARCTLKKADAHECQNVVVVDEDGKDVEYYMARNSVAETFGEVCTSTIKATVTGAVSEKDGRKWITPSRIEPAKS
jgi:hypothetical protein